MSKKPSKQKPGQLRNSANTELARPAEELLHELKVRQIELEMQNEALRKTQVELEESRDRYVDLYEFAPVGYLTLAPEATISEINLTGAALLGEERKKLLDRRFERFVAPEEHDRWNGFFLEALRKNEKHRCELMLHRDDGSKFYAAIACARVDRDSSPKTLRIALADITEYKLIEAELKGYQGFLRELAAQDVALREAESRHIAREVHDELGQLMTALRMEISLLRIKFGKLDPALEAKAKRMLALADKIIQGVRDVANNLHPAVLDMGIVPAIEWLCDNFPGRANTACTVKVIKNPVDLDNTRTVALFRIVQESLTNVARHAEADSVQIVIGQHGNHIAVEVCDDGKGFDPAALPAKQSFGLMGMRERVLAVGGKLDITSAPSKGTVVSILVPTQSYGA